MTTDDRDWTSSDAARVLAMPLHRQAGRKTYGDAVREMTYSNGTEADYAISDALDVIEEGPMLRRVLEAGVRALADDAQFLDYIVALYSGASDRLIELEAEARAAFPPDPEPEPGGMTPAEVVDAMTATLWQSLYPESAEA